MSQTIRTYTLLTVALMASLSLGISQESAHWCGTDINAQQILLHRIEENKESMYQTPVQFRDIQYVPVRFHLLANDDGSGLLAKHLILNQLCLLNEDFEPLGIQFYLYNGFNEIFNTEAYTNHSDNLQILRLAKDPDALNIFLPEDANPPNQGGSGVVLGYYDPSNDWLVIARSEVGKDDLTFPHEVGHFFSLAHPFVGWESAPWEEAIHGNPVTQILSPDGTLVELVDGSNCENAADKVCDTAADYLFGFGWTSCDFTPSVTDRNGDELDPDEKLWMNYFFGCNADEYYFTDMQQQLMIQDLSSPRRDYLRRTETPDITPITEAPTIITPAEEEEVPFYNAVNMSWSEVEGADYYLLQVALIPNFSPLFTHFDDFVEGTSITLEALDSNRTYYWRVRPISDFQVCTDFTEIHTFDTGSSFSTQQGNDDIAAFEVRRNPARLSEGLQLNIQANTVSSGDIKLYNLSGQLVRDYGAQDFSVGENSVNLPLGSLETAIYILCLDTPSGLLTRKILITQ
jgi:hypothetical protein